MSHEPDWQFLGTVAERLGLDWARALRDALASGTLIDLGECEYPSTPNREKQMPARRDAARPEQQVLELWEDTGRMGGKRGHTNKH